MAGPMELHLVIDAREPPVGTVVSGGAAPVPFGGWLDLLRVLSEALGGDGGPPAEAGSPRPHPTSSDTEATAPG